MFLTGKERQFQICHPPSGFEPDRNQSREVKGFLTQKQANLRIGRSGQARLDLNLWQTLCTTTEEPYVNDDKWQRERVHSN